MAIDDKEANYQASLGAGNIPEAAEAGGGVAASIQGQGLTGGLGGRATFPPGFGSAATPMYFTSVPTPKTTAISPYGNFLDVSSKEQKLLWREMVKPSADFVLLEMTVANSKAIIDLFTDKAITFRWMRYMRVPIHGDGFVGLTPNKTASGRDSYNAALSVFKNLLEDFNHLTLDDVMAFASWFMGDLTTGRSVRAPTDMTMKYLDVNATGNDGLVACFKQECRSVSCLVWHTIKNHFSATSYKALLVRKKDFAYECEETGDIVYDGYTLLRMIYMVVKPNVVIDVKDLQLKMEKMTIITADNNFHTLSTKLEELQQEINADKGDDFCKDDKLLTELFCAAEATTNEAFALDIRSAKNAWITGKQTDKHAIINELNVLYRNMVAEGSWKKTSTADSKIIALTTQVANLKKQLGMKNGGKGKDPKTSKKPGGKKEDGKNWRYTKVGDTTKCPETGATLMWCPHHGTGAYMPSNHNHKEWAENKRKRQEQYEQRRDAKRVRFEGDKPPKSDGDKRTDEKHPSKLQLSSALCQSLVTQCSMTPTEADSVLSKAFASASAGLKD